MLAPNHWIADWQPRRCHVRALQRVTRFQMSSWMQSIILSERAHVERGSPIRPFRCKLSQESAVLKKNIKGFEIGGLQHVDKASRF